MKKEKPHFKITAQIKEQALAEDIKMVAEAYKMDVERVERLPEDLKKEIVRLFLSNPSHYDYTVFSKINNGILRFEEIPVVAEFMDVPPEELQKLPDQSVHNMVGVYSMEKDISPDDVLKEHLKEQLEYELNDRKDEEEIL